MKTITTCFLFLCSIIVFGQKDFQGKAIYQKKTKVNVSKLENEENIPIEERRVLINALKDWSNRTFILHFNKSASTYKEEERLSTPTPSSSGGISIDLSSGGQVNYKNVSDKIFLTSKEVFGKRFIITKDLEMPSWEMTSETKKIGDFTCYKANLRKKNKKQEDFYIDKKGKKKQDSIQNKRPKEYLVSVWYTPQIPVSNGPDSYWGLPGLILEVNEKETTLLCTELVLNSKKKFEIKKLTKGKKVTEEEYDKIIKALIKERNERFTRKRKGKSQGGF